MKTRTAAFVLALCLISSMSFAESATDAPLAVSDPYAGAVQPAQSTNTAKPHNNKKKNKCKAQQTAQTKDKKQQEEQPYHETPSQTDMGPSMQYGG